MRDQPLLLVHRAKIALNVYQGVRAFREAERNLSPKAFGQWTSSNARIMELMELVWRLQGVMLDG